eukprot:TRINITY_DN5489_c0_g1_i1.p1 TRINITY_DN5489_c0_g1~~TRINITY_DN5489_c0_g1_i1.p1  ORF type:complete len:437 (+),score=115.35 TRINITY_DN5489_c0_g1_i1:164-1312(+)
MNEQHWKECRHVKQKGPVKRASEKPKSKTAIGYADNSDEDSDDYVPVKKTATKKKVISSSSSEDDTDDYDDKGKGKGKAVVPKKTTTKPALVKKASVSKIFGDSVPTDSVMRAGLAEYKGILETVLESYKISADSKKLLLNIRSKKQVTREEHNQLLAQYGWTEDEYEIGEKEIEVDLEAEKEVLCKDDGFCLVTLKKGQKMTKEEDNVWSKASAKFYQTMAKAQGNYEIASLGIIVNTKLKNQFEKQRAEFEKDSAKRGRVEWGFHGTTAASIKAISQEGFKHPDELKKKKKGKVALLDDGYFGNGIYFSMYSDYAMWYSEERESDQILLCSLLPGKEFQCKERMDGEGLKKGYDSHFSPKGNEIIIFNPSQILPRYIISL